MTFDDKMQMITLRKGTNEFTCMPDNPDTPGMTPSAMTRPDLNLRWPGCRTSHLK